MIAEICNLGNLTKRRKWRMKRWITPFVCLLFATAVLMTGGCSGKEEPTKTAAKVAKPPEPEKKAEGAKPGEAKPATQIVETIKKYLDAFNANDLDTVMTCFSDDAIYQPGDGKTHRGKAEIRAAFEPQFNGAYGAMRFDEHDRIIDVENRKMAIRYVCRHDISDTKPRGLVMFFRGIVTRLFVGKRFGWQGVDVFHFDADGKIKEKYSYSWFGSSPHLQPELG
jgi:ketosteroid isomerase-like protein